MFERHPLIRVVMIHGIMPSLFCKGSSRLRKISQTCLKQVLTLFIAHAYCSNWKLNIEVLSYNILIGLWCCTCLNAPCWPKTQKLEVKVAMS